MRSASRRLAQLLGIAGTLVAAFAAPGGSSAAPARGCASFASQAAAEAYFTQLGGRPNHAVGRLDGNGDGIACDSRGAPYAGFASIGYNRRKGFFYGYAWMPQKPGSAEFACLYGNRHFPDGPRNVTVYKLEQGREVPLRGPRGEAPAEASPETGRLVWKLNVKRAHGRYYAAFEERIPLTPYGHNECPGFRSYAIAVP